MKIPLYRVFPISSNAAFAAICSASFFDLPTPVPMALPLVKTDILKVLA